MKYFGLLCFLVVCFIGIGHAQMDMYFESEESSGDDRMDTVDPDLPIDDEDTDEMEGSGLVITKDKKEDDDDVELEVINVDEEPEVTGDKEKTPKIVLPTEDKTKKVLIEEEIKPEEKNVKETELEDAEKEPVESAAGSSFIAAIVTGCCIGLLFAICVIMLLVYRMRKKDEGSYALEYGLDAKKPQGNYEYTKGVAGGKEYYA